MVKSTTTFGRTTASLAAVAAFVLTLGAVGTATAQDGSGSEDGAETAETNEAEGSADKKKKKKKAEQLDPSDPDYWAKQRKVQTVQKREFQKVNRLAISAYGGIVPNNIFEKYYPIGARLNYFIVENIGLELAGSYALTQKTDLESVLRDESGVAAGDVRVGDTQIGQVNFGVVWSPFYGKAAFHNSSIGYFDLFLFGGAGLIITRAPEEGKANQPPAEQPRTPKPEGVVGAGLAYYFANGGAVRIDYRQFVFQNVIGGVANPSEVSVGIGWFF